jgi:hypothetical protein
MPSTAFIGRQAERCRRSVQADRHGTSLALYLAEGRAARCRRDRKSNSTDRHDLSFERRGAVNKRPQWDDEDDDWNQPRRTFRPDQIPPATPGWKPSIVTWMYVIFGVLVIVQILRFYFD